MRNLAIHLACLEELERDERRRSPRRLSPLSAIAALTGSALWIAGAWFLEELVRERLGLP